MFIGFHCKYLAYRIIAIAMHGYARRKKQVARYLTGY